MPTNLTEIPDVDRTLSFTRLNDPKLKEAIMHKIKEWHKGRCGRGHIKFGQLSDKIEIEVSDDRTMISVRIPWLNEGLRIYFSLTNNEVDGAIQSEEVDLSDGDLQAGYEL